MLDSRIALGFSAALVVLTACDETTTPHPTRAAYLVKPVPLNLPVQRAFADAQLFSGLTTVPVGVFEG